MDQKEDKFHQELVQLQRILQDSAIFSSKEYPKLAKRLKELEEIIDHFDKIATLQSQLTEARELAGSSDQQMAGLAATEIDAINTQLDDNNALLTNLLTPKDPNDDRDVIVEIRGAAGGDESSLFAGELYRMYIRWCETHGYKTELISESPNEVGGFKEVIFAARGEEAYKNLKFEAGVHRVQRVPATESQGRIHTSTVTVSVLPEAEETDVDINPSDLRIDVYRSSGHGGHHQHGDEDEQSERLRRSHFILPSHPLRRRDT